MRPKPLIPTRVGMPFEVGALPRRAGRGQHHVVDRFVDTQEIQAGASGTQEIQAGASAIGRRPHAVRDLAVGVRSKE